MENRKRFCLLLAIYLAVAFLCWAYSSAFMNFLFQKNKSDAKNNPAASSSNNTTNHLRLRAPSIKIKNATVPQSTNTTSSIDTMIRIGEERKQQEKPNCLIFMHIPKVAGSSLKVLLENITRTDGYSLAHVYSKVESPHSLKVNNTFIMGHFTTAIFEQRHELLKCYKVTMLREPIERAISAFFFHGHQTHEIDYCLEKEGINRCKLNWQYKNDLTRYIAGSPKTKWNTYLEYTYNSYPMNVTHVKVAKEHLKKYFDLVCFTTDLMSCARNITSTFQVNTEHSSINLSFFDSRKKGVHFNKEKPILNQTLVDKFRTANSIDSELYKWASLHYGRSIET